MSEEAEATTEEAPARPVRSGRRRPPPRSKSVEDSGSLAQMRASRNGDKSEEAAAEGGEATAEGGRPRRGGRRAPARTKSADDMAAMVRMRKKKSKDESKDGEEEKQ